MADQGHHHHHHRSQQVEQDIQALKVSTASSRTSRMSMNRILQTMVMSFRVTELSMLLQHANKNKSGKKSELQARAVEVAKQAVLRNNVQTMVRSLS